TVKLNKNKGIRIFAEKWKKHLLSLPPDTVRLLGSSQVITSVYSVVKELVENSFDAEATSLDVKLENYGLDRVEVRDNGSGIRLEWMPLVAQRHHTSKISSFSDLETVATYGFRGEAVGSLCSVSDLTITSKNRSEEVGHTFSFDHHGNITSQQPSHIAQVKKKKEELKKIEELLYAYGIIHPGARIILRHNKEIVWQKTGVPDTRAALSLVLGRSVVQLMEQHSVQDKDTNICVECFLPLSDSDVMATSRATNDRSFLAVNNRPVVLKELEKVLKQYYNHERSSESRHPVYFLHLKLSTSDLDINVDPNKTRVFLHCQAEVLKLLTGIFEKIYGPLQQDKPDKNKTKETFNDNLEHSTISNDSESSFDTMVEKHPSASFDKISTMVRSKWAELSEEERQTYETQGNSQMAELKKRVAAGKKLANKMDRRIQPVKGMPSIKDQLLSSHKKPEEPIKSVSVPFSLHHLRGRYKSGLRLTQPHSTANKRRKLIGPLKYYHGWVCIHGNLIQLVNPHRFEETVLHRELMENHIIPVSKLENPMGLTESSVGGEQLFQTLVKMIPPQTSHTYSYIDDIRLKANGFEVRCHQDGESRPVLELVSMATCMPTYGVPDLKEVLDLITNTGASSLYQARPLKVIYYLQGEAVRMI
ncbi:PMS1-like protein, partial [Mya arenaria]